MYKIDDGDSYDTGVGRAHSDNNEEGGINFFFFFLISYFTWVFIQVLSPVLP